MHVGNARLPRRAIPQMSHVEFTGERKTGLSMVHVCQLLCTHAGIVLMYLSEDFGDGVRAFSPFAEHVFMSGLRIKLDTRHACAFLPPVVLFFHHQIELIQAIHPCAVLLLIVFKRLQ